MDAEKIKCYTIGRILSSISDHDWPWFVSEKLNFKEEDLQQFETKYSSPMRIDITEKWEKEQQITDVFTELGKLVDEFRKTKRRIIAGENAYPIRRGKSCALIIVNSFEWCKESRRKIAAEADVELMEKLWKGTFGCKLFGDKVHRDLPSSEMEDMLKKLSDQKKEEYDYIVVVISTHGGLIPESVMSEFEPEEKSIKSFNEPSSVPIQKASISGNEMSKVEAGESGIESQELQSVQPEGEGLEAEYIENYEEYHKKLDKASKNKEKSTVEMFLGNDYKPIRERKIKKYFYNDSKTTALHHVPKFFILDYCRGSTDGVIVPNRKADGSKSEMNRENAEITSLLPTVSDVLVVYATHYEYVAYDSRGGSWLISTIASVFKNHYEEKHVIELLTMVNRRMKNRVEKYKAMSVYESSLEKDFYLK